MEFIARDVGDLEEVAQIVLDKIGKPSVVLLDAEMGAGKTTFVAALCKKLGTLDSVSSPTFSLVNIYRTESGQEVIHIDLYRLESTDEFLEAGMEEYLHHDQWVFIEWPELALPFLEGTGVRISIEEIDGGKRKITIL